MANLIDTINKKVSTTTSSMYGNPSVPPVQQTVAPMQGPQPLVGPVKPKVVTPITPKITPTITPPIDTTITADKLKGTTSYILPEKTIDDSPSKVGSIVDQFKSGQNMSYEQGLTDIKNKYNNTSEVTDLMRQISGVESSQTNEANKLRAQENLQAYKKYTTDIDLENERTRQSIEDIRKNNPEGALRGGQSDLINNLQRESGNRLAILTIQRSAALGDYNTAIETAKAKVDMQLAPLKAQLEQLKYVQDYNKDFQTAEINMLAKKKENEIKKEEERLTKGEEMIINAQMQKAPSSLVTKAREILENGGTKADVTSILGDYSMSPADKLDLRIKRAQLEKLNTENIGVSKESLKQTQQLKAQVPVIKEKLNLVDSILSNQAITTTVGPSRTARGGYFVGIPFVGGIGATPEAITNRLTGQKQNLIAGVNQLVSKEFLQSILNLKAQGGTLGQLTEREGEKLQQAATKIGSWEIRNEDGEVTGYNVNEKDFVDELNKIKSSVKNIYEASGGDTKELMNEEEYTQMINKQLQDNPYLEAGYIN